MWFDKNGWLLKRIPKACVEECTLPGVEASDSVNRWLKKLSFTVDRQQAIAYLKEFGAWPLESDKYDKGLNDMTSDELAQRVLWIACGDLKENNEWLGMIH